MKAIMINLSDEGGAEVYELIDAYRFSKKNKNGGSATWKQLVLQSIILSMLRDGSPHSDKVIAYATKK